MAHCYSGLKGVGQMYDKGIVFELLEKVAIVLTQDQQFVKVKKKEGLEVGQTIFFLPEDVVKPTPKVIPFYKKTAPTLALIAACLLIFIIPFGKPVTPYATLSVDVNPSFELELDEAMAIRKVNALNKSAQALNVQALEGLPLQEGLEQLKQILIENNISLESNAMLFSLALSNQDDLDYENQVKESLKQANQTEEFAYLKITEEELELAHQQSVSGAKLKVKELLQDIDVDDISVNEIIQLFKDNKLHFDLLFKDGIELDDDLEDTLEDLFENDDDDDDDDHDNNYNDNQSVTPGLNSNSDDDDDYNHDDNHDDDDEDLDEDDDGDDD